MDIQVNYENFCYRHPYRVVGPEELPERRFATLIAAARTVIEAGPKFHAECGSFKASYNECRSLAAESSRQTAIDEARQKSKYWEKIG